MKIDPAAVDPRGRGDALPTWCSRRSTRRCAWPRSSRRSKMGGATGRLDLGAPRRARSAGSVSSYAPPFQRLVTELSKLPGIGNRTAQRLAFHILRASTRTRSALAEAIRRSRRRSACARSASTSPTSRAVASARTRVATSHHLCRGGAKRRDPDGAHARVPWALPRARRRASPIDGVEPEDLKIAELYARVADGEPARCARWCSRRIRRPRARPRRFTSPRSCDERAAAADGHPACLAACRSAPTSSTPTRSRWARLSSGRRSL